MSEKTSELSVEDLERLYRENFAVPEDSERLPPAVSDSYFFEQVSAYDYTIQTYTTDSTWRG